jgi:hypothetical protein
MTAHPSGNWQMTLAFLVNGSISFSVAQTRPGSPQSFRAATVTAGLFLRRVTARSGAPFVENTGGSPYPSPRLKLFSSVLSNGDSLNPPPEQFKLSIPILSNNDSLKLLREQFKLFRCVLNNNDSSKLPPEQFKLFRSVLSDNDSHTHRRE